MSGIEVLRTGSQTLIQDLGRPGLAAIGVSRSGAVDVGAYALGARLLGHDFTADRTVQGRRDPGPAALEVLLGGLEFRVHGEITVALTGAVVPATVDGRATSENYPVCRNETVQLTYREHERPGVTPRTFGPLQLRLAGAFPG